jgi:membrane protease YdiL (CAAX protease family)
MVPILVGLWIGVAEAVAVVLFSASYFHIPISPNLPSLATVLYLSVATPLFEETLFRGLMLQGSMGFADYLKDRGLIGSRRLFIFLVVVVQGAVFGALHLFKAAEIGVFLLHSALGIVAGFLVWKFGSLKPAIAQHAVYNLVIAFLV